MSNTFIEGTFSRLAPADMRNGYPRHHGGLRCSQNLKAITKHDQNIGLELVEYIGETNDAQPNGFCDSDGGIGRKQHLDLGINIEAVRFDLFVSQSEFGREVHASGDDL